MVNYLIRPRWGGGKRLGESTYDKMWLPVSIGNAAGILLRDGHDVRVVDAEALNLSAQDVAAKVEWNARVFITSSSFDRWWCPSIDIQPFVDTARAIKMRTENLYVMGFHCTVDADRIINLTAARAAIIGEPEETIKRIVSENDRLESIAGITYHSDGALVSNPSVAKPDLKRFPIFPFHLFPLDKYHYELMPTKRFMTFEVSRSCPYTCAYCTKAMVSGPRRMKTVYQIMTEIIEAVQNHGITAGYLLDQEFCADRNFVMDLCNRLRKEGLNFVWACQTRADLLDDEILSVMKGAGCDIIHCGVESASDRILKIINKGTTSQRQERGIKKIKKHGIRCVVFFTIGFPTETYDEMRQTIDWAIRVRPDFAAFHVFTPYPGTAIAKCLGLSKYPIRRCLPEHDEKALFRMTRMAARRFYLSPNFILHHVRSVHLREIGAQLRLLTNSVFR